MTLLASTKLKSVGGSAREKVSKKTNLVDSTTQQERNVSNPDEGVDQPNKGTHL